MNIFSSSIKFLKWRFFANLLTLFSIILAVGTAIAVLIISLSFREGIFKGMEVPPLIVGAKGSPIQLVWNTLFFGDNPPGIIDYSIFQKLSQKSSIQKAIPVAVADIHQGFRIIGTVKDYFRLFERYQLQEGKYFEENSKEIVIGSEVKNKLGLKIGNFINIPSSDDVHFSSTKPHQVVGIMNPTGTAVDRGIFCSLKSVWETHYNPLENTPSEGITAILIYPRNSQDLYELAAQYNKFPNLQTVMTFEVFNELLEIVGSAEKVLKVISWFLLLMAGITVFLSMNASLNEHRRDIGLMRAIGIGKSTLLSIVFLESFVLAFVGITLGWLLGRAGIFFVQHGLQSRLGFYFHAPTFTWHEGIWILFFILFFSIIGLLPALSIYTTNVWQEIYFPRAKLGFGFDEKARTRLKKIFLFIIIPLFFLISGIQANRVTLSLNEDSFKFFRMLRSAGYNDTLELPYEIQNLSGKEIEIEGFMLPPLGNQMSMQSFFISDYNPNAPKCPFCYNPPPKMSETIQVISNRADVDYTRYPVKVRGVFEAEKRDNESYYRLRMKEFKVIVVR